MGNRFIKQTAAVVLLTTSVLSFSSVAFGASTSVDQSVNKVKMELNKAATEYVYPALDGKLASSDSLYPVLNSAKKNYQNAVKEIQSSKLSQTEKQAKLKEIETLYNEKITKGLVPYIDAYNYATKYLDPLLADIKVAEAKNDFAAVEKAYHQISYQLKGRTAILYRFSGKASRDLLLDKYKQPSDQKRDELMVPVTIYMKTVEVEKLVKEGKLEEAKKVMESIQALVDRLPSSASNSFVTALLKNVEKVKEVVTPVTPPAAGGGGGGGGGVTSPSGNDILNSMLSEQVKLGNTATGSKVEISMVGNKLNVLIKENSTLGHFYDEANRVFSVFKSKNTTVESATVTYKTSDGDITIGSSNNGLDFDKVIEKALAKVNLDKDTSLSVLDDKTITLQVTGTISGKEFKDTYTFKFETAK
ncbi:hypothetical protein ACFVR1_06975 [Psychrobacillus sp. NPDC058041]|uniref:hypothetical protein n=1 Tax=Psychrobacillus sp. NPDC058041 TaxID=3346310 RepID=UPI0036DD8037